ncbi:hypothetical protein [Cellulophaga sp. L1A9]|uniref:hypothetical protein n=1 Tax=Cellulophaga sp. L1A9 TaxID=2686362 RepID=UPI00131AF932|nr:hypothetical protein [Cellulophaga sp. L1A9]
MTKGNSKKITSDLFLKDIRDNSFKKLINISLAINLDEVLADYELDEIDEYPIDIDDKGIMIGFGAETIKVPPRIEYIDLNIKNNPNSINYLEKKIDINQDFSNLNSIKKQLAPYSHIRVFYKISDLKTIKQIVFEYLNLRYELIITENNELLRIRLSKHENESDINMRPVYAFG